MNDRHVSISAYEVMYSLIPKLNTIEKQVKSTLAAPSAFTQDAAHQQRYQTLKSEFELELLMIRMNLEHLLQRYATELEAVTQGSRHDIYLTLDTHEATAIDRAKQLYQRIQAWQTRDDS
ncbi:hypothetical protein LG290_00540 [Halomonas sediminis]